MGTGHLWLALIGHWRKNIPVLAAGGYRVFALDLLGFGGSDKPPLDYTLELWRNYSDFWTAHSGTCCICRQFDGAPLSLMVVADYPQLLVAF